MRPRIAVCHPRLGRGGSEARALWLLQALRQDHDLTLITLGEVDLSSLNAYYGTDLADEDFTIDRPRCGRWLARRRRGDALRGALLHRFVRRRSASFDLCVSAHNPLDFGRRSVQFVADFSFLPATRQRLHGHTAALEGGGLLRALGRRGYAALVRLVRGRPAAASAVGEDDVLVANSSFASEVLERDIRRRCSHVIYPPVAGPLGGAPVHAREAVFVSIGRVSREKRIEEQIAILRAVRERGHDVTLRIHGGPLEGGYAERVRRLVSAEGGWVTWEGWIGGAAKWDLLQGARFGIQTCRGEAFGISAAEMVRAGCIVFVPTNSGPAEIVADDRLTFDGPDQAVDRVCEVLKARAVQQRLSEELVNRGATFSIERFCSETRQLVAAVLA